MLKSQKNAPHNSTGLFQEYDYIATMRASFEKKTTQSAACWYFNDLNVNIKIFSEGPRNSHSI